MIRIAMIALVLAACGCSGDKNAGGPDSPFVIKWTELRDRMCACPDVACANKVTEAYQTWATSSPPPDKLDRSQIAKSVKLSDEYQACSKKLSSAGK